MASYNILKTQVSNAITTNGNEEITGQVLRNLLNNNLIPSLGAKYQFAGVATPDTNPGTPDYKVAYIAATAGTYSHIGNFTLQAGEIAVLYRDTNWQKATITTISAGAVPFILNASTNSKRRYLIVRFDAMIANTGNVDVEVSGVHTTDETAFRGTYHIAASQEKIAANYFGDAELLTTVVLYEDDNYDYLIFDLDDAPVDLMNAAIFRKTAGTMPVEVSFADNLPSNGLQIISQWPQVDTPILHTADDAGSWVTEEDVAEFDFSIANSFAGRVIEIYTADAGSDGAAYGVTIPSTSASFGEAMLIVVNDNASGNLCSISGPNGFFIEEIDNGKTVYINLLLTPFGVYVKSYHII
jgi:hypothetical protein